MKVLLIRPYRCFYGDSSTWDGVGLPLGLLSIAAVLEKEKHEVKIVDFFVDSRSKLQNIENDTSIYGLPETSLKEEVENFKPDVVGISNMFSAQILGTIKAAEAIKRIVPKARIVVGGAHTAVKGVELLQENSCVDFGIVGEGEYALVELLAALQNKKKFSEINGLIYRDQKKVIKNPLRAFIARLDDLPFPAYHLIDMEAYLTLYKREMFGRDLDEKRCVSIVTSRGCPFNCVFCSIKLHMGKMWRAHSPEYVIEHLKLLTKKYGVEQIHFEDDNLTFNKKRTNEILDLMIKEKIPVKWDTPNGVRADTLDEPILEKMKKSGCKGLKIAIESGDQYILDNVVKKSLKLDKVIEVAKTCKKLKIPLGSFYIIGFPGEKVENMENTANFALMLLNKYGVKQWGAAQAVPLFGTELYEICDKQKLFTREVNPRSLSDSMFPFSKGLIKTKDFSQEDMDRINNKLVGAMYKDHLKNPIRFAKFVYKLRKRILPKVKMLVKNI